MEHEDLLDASEEVLACDTLQEESTASLTQKIIKKLNISSSNRVSETVNNTQSSISCIPSGITVDKWHNSKQNASLLCFNSIYIANISYIN